MNTMIYSDRQSVILYAQRGSVLPLLMEMIIMFFLPPAVLSSAHTFMMPRRYVKGDFNPWHAYWGSSSPNSPSRLSVLGQCTLALVELDLHAELVDVDGGKVLRLRGDGCVPRDYHIHHAINRLHPKGERRGVEHHVIDMSNNSCLVFLLYLSFVLELGAL
jgi:hypothetical protein